MYGLIVASKLTAAFRLLDAGDVTGVLPAFAPAHRHRMHGEHALGGTRTTLASTRRWYERLGRLLPNLRFTLGRVVVSGMPWDTRAVVDWTDSFSLPDGSVGTNQGVHVFGLRWGRVVSLDVHCDTARLGRYLERMAELGCEEALATPICD